ncbi:PREDICTED: uncharacterized protein LOC108567356 [Nicrophorus vespilloides]|uniref:Uncharacterized protein LOC108567356 n=1 Tax=Nicrophorus vespilloides TaxID=110193 RepID=A0ABM1N8W0_NICVS|nr:PREDICTED: uncharacterized protein LOC108567356 [Nicrophorus vespilloides]
MQRYGKSGSEITPKKVIIYLGISIDSNLTYAEHIRAVAIRAAETTTAVSRLMHNKAGPKSSKSRSSGTIYYARQRGATKADARARLLQKWQDKWHRSEKEAWTRRLIPQIEPWLSRKHGEKTFHLSQAPSGHGCFGKYLHFIARRKTKGAGTVRSTIALRCCRWVGRKHEAEAAAELGVLLEPENVISKMLKNAENWDILAAYISEVLLSKKGDKRRLQRVYEDSVSGGQH